MFWNSILTICEPYATASAHHPLPRLEVTIERRAEKKTLSRKEREGVKGRDLMKRYPADKAKSLMASLRAKGLWYWDTEFPGDEEELGNWAQLCFHWIK